ncbi:hypothetical protein ACOSP7_003348 [Xanthoceras sorbifolium]
MKRDFVNLKQRQMSVTEYEREFNRLSKYASDMVLTEESRCRRFEDGLNNYIRLQVAVLEIVDFTRLVSAALIVERVQTDEQARKNWSQQRRGQGQSSSSQPPSKRGNRVFRASGEDRYLKTEYTEFDVIVSSPLGHSVIVNRTLWFTAMLHTMAWDVY